MASPKGYDEPIKVRYDGTLVFERYSSTNDKLFTKERTRLPTLIYHVIVFALDTTECGKDDAKTSFERGRFHCAHINAGHTCCWFMTTRWSCVTAGTMSKGTRHRELAPRR
jgi:hypothetical protein